MATTNFGASPLAGPLNGTESVPLWQSGARRVLMSDLVAYVTAAGYVLPIATPVALGGVKVGTGLAVAGDGTLSVTYSYTLPAATAGTLGGVKAGSGLTVAGDGTLAVQPAQVIAEATTARTATTAQAGQYTRFTNAGTKTYTFDTAQAYVVGSEYHGRNVGAGNLTLVGAGGMVLNAPAGGTLVIPQNGTFTVKIVGGSEADVFGAAVVA